MRACGVATCALLLRPWPRWRVPKTPLTQQRAPRPPTAPHSAYLVGRAEGLVLLPVRLPARLNVAEGVRARARGRGRPIGRMLRHSLRERVEGARAAGRRQSTGHADWESFTWRAHACGARGASCCAGAGARGRIVPYSRHRAVGRGSARGARACWGAAEAGRAPHLRGGRPPQRRAPAQRDAGAARARRGRATAAEASHHLRRHRACRHGGRRGGARPLNLLNAHALSSSQPRVSAFRARLKGRHAKRWALRGLAQRALSWPRRANTALCHCISPGGDQREAGLRQARHRARARVLRGRAIPGAPLLQTCLARGKQSACARARRGAATDSPCRRCW